VWSTGWIIRLWRSKGATLALPPIKRAMASNQAWLLRMVHRADDFTRFSDMRHDDRPGRRGGIQTPRDDESGSRSIGASRGFDLVPHVADRRAASSDEASSVGRRNAG
jgi:hypothetical protein